MPQGLLVRRVHGGRATLRVQTNGEAVIALPAGIGVSVTARCGRAGRLGLRGARVLMKHAMIVRVRVNHGIRMGDDAAEYEGGDQRKTDQSRKSAVHNMNQPRGTANVKLHSQEHEGISAILVSLRDLICG